MSGLLYRLKYSANALLCVQLVPPYTGGKAVAAGSSILRLTVNREGGVKGAGCARAVWCECGVLPKTIVH